MMRRIIKASVFAVAAVFFAAFLPSCSGNDCSINSHVFCNYSICSADGDPLAFSGRLSVSVKRNDGTDTVLINCMENAHRLQLPMSYTAEQDTLLFTLETTDGMTISDKVFVCKKNLPHMEAIECGTVYHHKLQSVSSTHNFIDTVVIKNDKVTNDPTIEHLQLVPIQ